MPKAIPFCLILFSLIIGCSAPNKPLLNSNNLPSAFFTLNGTEAYQLKTSKGALIKIAANSFEVAAGTRIQLEVKEAYTMKDILLAGLGTTSNGKPLESGGMIYFNVTANGDPVKFLKKVGITIPSVTYNPAMELFKGEYNKDSTINWVSPEPLDTSPVAKHLQSGKALFKANCANCHKPLNDYTGPALAGARLRAPFYNWSAYWVNNVNSMLEYDPYAKSLHAKYGSRMTQFALPKADIDAILDYADNEAELQKPGTLQRWAANYNPGVDSAKYSQRITDCGFDTIPVYNSMVAVPDSAADDQKRDTLEYANGAFDTIPSYAFSINYSGWYNIDRFLKENGASVKEVTLTASLTQEIDETVRVYLCIPSQKLLVTGSQSSEGRIVFNYGDSTIQLVPGVDAFIFATGGTADHAYYGITPFTVSQQQHISVKIIAAKPEEIKAALKRNKLGGVIFDPMEPAVEAIIPAIPPGSQQSGADTSNPGMLERRVIKIPCVFDSDTIVRSSYFQ